jgi:hypothetical protein
MRPWRTWWGGSPLETAADEEVCPTKFRFRARIKYHPLEEIRLAEDKTYKAEYVGSGTFIISKPKRTKAKRRQTNLKNPQRGARK